MKPNIQFLSAFFTVLLLGLVFVACEDDEKVRPAPVIVIDEAYTNIDGLNVGDEVTIPVKVTSPLGVRRLAYFFITETANGTQSSTPVYFDPEDFPQELNQNIVFTVVPGLLEVVIVSFDRQNNSSEVHLSPGEIRPIPQLTFKDGVKFRETVYENKLLTIEGLITSEYDLATVSYRTIIEGVTSEPTAITITDKRNMPFAVSVRVATGLSGVVISAENIHEGAAVDTFRIGQVADDDVNIALEGGNTTVPIGYAEVENVLNGTVFSGSDMVELTYAIKQDGNYGAETALDLGDPKDEFNFSLQFVPNQATEAIRITGKNAGGITKSFEFPIEKIYTRLLHFTDIKLTSEIGPGLNNWFAAYQAPHVFDATNAAANQLMLDFALVKYSSTSFRIMPAAVYVAGDAYASAMAPYMEGFTKATYTLVTVNRNAITPEAFESLEWDGEMTEFLNTKIIAPVAQGGEGYNIAATNRRFNGDLVPGKAFIIGWGQWDPIQNKAFGIVMVKEYSVTDGVATATLEIKVPAEDQRTKYNPVSLFDYPQ